VSLPPGCSGARRLGGGDINEAFYVVLADGREAFVKTRRDAGEGEYAAEAAGLGWLAEPGALRTPRVLELDERYLVLEWVPPGGLDAAGAEELGRGLAATHAAGAPCFGDPSAGAAHGESGDGAAHGESGDGAAHGESGDAAAAQRDANEGSGGLSRFGSLQLANDPAPDWPTFYAERRLAPLARIAAEREVLSASGIDALERVCSRMAELAGPAEPPARLHGDLWSGNVMGDRDGRPWLIDPSPYGGHREVDLAMLRLFGAPSERIFAAYEEATPLSDGWQERVELYQLAPLLVHALLFGGSYRSSAERVAISYAR
jgi:fructosamine-3-kinase